MQLVYVLCSCGCTCLQRLVGGLLLLVCGLSELAVSLLASMKGLCWNGWQCFVNYACMWMHMFAKLGWWIVVACRWLVHAGFLMCVSMIDVC